MQDVARFLTQRGKMSLEKFCQRPDMGIEKVFKDSSFRRSPRFASSFGSHRYSVRHKIWVLSQIHNHTPYHAVFLWLFSESGRDSIAIAGVVVVRVPVGVHIAKVRRVGRIRRTEPPIRGNKYQDATYLRSIHLVTFRFPLVRFSLLVQFRRLVK